MNKAFDTEFDFGAQDRYQIVREIGRGASSLVYEACDTRLGRAVAMKLLTFPPALSAAQRSDLAARFSREAEAVSALSHPGIVSVFEVGRAADGRQCLVMERLVGETLRARLLREGRIPAREAVEIGRQAAEALGYAHERGIVHRDVKPDNIFLTADGRVKVMDFGVAWLRADGGQTQAGTVIGSPAYMAPEQINGQTPDARADVFSLGATLFEMIAGRKPFDAPTIPAVMNQILREKPPLALIEPSALRSVLARALAKRPDARFASMTAFADALHRCETGASSYATVPPNPDATIIMARPKTATARERRQTSYPSIAFAAALALLAGVLLYPWRRITAHLLPAQASVLPTRQAQTPPSQIIPTPRAVSRRAAVLHTSRVHAHIAPKKRSLLLTAPLIPAKTASKTIATAPFISEPYMTPRPAAKPMHKPAVLTVQPARAARLSMPHFSLAARVQPEETPQVKIAAMRQERRLPARAFTPDSASADAPDGESISYADPAAPHESESDDAPPRALTRFAPPYPQSALASSQGGTVRLRVLVDENGAVDDAEVIRSSGSAALDEAAQQCVRRWVYEPARQNGRPVPAAITERIVFRHD